MYWWNDQLSRVHRECLAARKKYTRSKGDSALHEVCKNTILVLRQGIKKNWLRSWKDLIGEAEKDSWGLDFKIVTKRLATRRKTPSLDSHDLTRHIVQSPFPLVESFLREDWSSCTVQYGELFTFEVLERAGRRLKANTVLGFNGVPNEIFRCDHGIPGEPPRSLQLLSSRGKVTNITGFTDDVCAYRIMSTSALLVQASLPPIHLFAKERQKVFLLRKELTSLNYEQKISRIKGSHL